MLTCALVNRIISSSLVDGPGSRMAIFLQGCNLACLYCHNPETQAVCTSCGDCVIECPSGALGITGGQVVWDSSVCQHCDRCLTVCKHHASPKVQSMSVRQVMDLVRVNAPFLHGITISGGECTLQHEWVAELLAGLGQSGLGLGALIDTNGQMSTQTLSLLAGRCDGFIFDLKALDAGIHARLTGHDNTQILANLRRAADLDRLQEVRTVIVPGFTDDAAEVKSIASHVHALGPTTRLRLTAFRPEGVRGVLANRPALVREKFAALCAVAREVLGERLVVAPDVDS